MEKHFDKKDYNYLTSCCAMIVGYCAKPAGLPNQCLLSACHEKAPFSWHPAVYGTLDNGIYSVGGPPTDEKGYSERVEVCQLEQEFW